MNLTQTTYPLSDCISLYGGGTPSKDKPEYWDGDIPWASVKDLKAMRLSTTEDSISVLGLTNSASKIVKAGSIIIATRMAVGRVTITEFDVAINQDLKAIVCSDKVGIKYLFYFLFSQENNFNKVASGATVKGIKIHHIMGMKIPLPSLAEQQKIASVLDAADSLRQKDQQLIEKYTALSQSLFLDMFGDPVSNPVGWDKKLLNEMGVIYTGNTPPRANPEYYGDEIEWIKTNNINTPNMYLTLAEESLSNSGLSVGRSVDANSLLVTCIAGSKKVIGNVAIANRKVAFNQQINSFTPSDGSILYFYYLFIVGKKHVQSFSTDSMKGMINKSKFERIDFISPPITLQNQFAERIQAIESQKQQALASLQKSEDLFNSLLQRAFKGELI